MIDKRRAYEIMHSNKSMAPEGKTRGGHRQQIRRSRCPPRWSHINAEEKKKVKHRNTTVPLIGPLANCWHPRSSGFNSKCWEITFKFHRLCYCSLERAGSQNNRHWTWEKLTQAQFACLPLVKPPQIFWVWFKWKWAAERGCHRPESRDAVAAPIKWFIFIYTVCASTFIHASNMYLEHRFRSFSLTLSQSIDFILIRSFESDPFLSPFEVFTENMQSPNLLI